MPIDRQTIHIQIAIQRIELDHYALHEDSHREVCIRHDGGCTEGHVPV